MVAYQTSQNYLNMTTDILDLSKKCRLCLEIGKNVRWIFGDNNTKWAISDISQIIYDCTKIEVTVNDCTTGICLLCYKEIMAIIAFRTRCAKANEFLKSRTSNKNCDKGTEGDREYFAFIDLGDEEGLTSNFLCEKNDHFEEISDYEMPSLPDFHDDKVLNVSDDMAESQPDGSEGKYMNLENTSRKAQPKSWSKMKSSSKQSQNNISEDWPKLKKRDLIETKAYRGLCHLCGKEYQHLWVHLQSHSEVPTETCDKCGKGFRSKANLSLHILLHKEADMPCEVCGKKYRTKMRLKRHMRVHTQNRPFFCNICQKRFYTKYNLEVHSRIHSGERPFGCSVKNCNERFAHSYALKHHMEKAHKHASGRSN